MKTITRELKNEDMKRQIKITDCPNAIVAEALEKQAEKLGYKKEDEDRFIYKENIFLLYNNGWFNWMPIGIKLVEEYEEMNSLEFLKLETAEAEEKWSDGRVLSVRIDQYDDIIIEHTSNEGYFRISKNFLKELLTRAEAGQIKKL